MRDEERVGLSRLITHPSFRLIATAKPTACVWVCDKLIDQCVKPNSAAKALACPCNTNSGRLRPSHTTSTSTQRISPIPVPMALATASFTAKRPAKLVIRPSQYACSCGVKKRSRNRCPCRDIPRSIRATSIISTPDVIMIKGRG